MTTKTGVSFYDDVDRKEFKVDKMPKAWLEACTLLTDGEAFEQWKQEQLDFKAEHPILNFCRLHKKLVIIVIVAIIAALLLF